MRSSLLTQGQGGAELVQVWVPPVTSLESLWTSTQIGRHGCLENREASATADEDNNHQIPATQLQRCLCPGLL